ncbi:hypothetical protein [Herbaspirillum robiniae]|uniref:hypothetical protein n=1 Tax=Herbaspirillum robiniae TaxID=2014887 RepID=UPI0011E4CF7C|nr:hypothetical protein [Herbaspirillum robiniae]
MIYGYAVNKAGGWRRVESGDDCLEGESFVTEQPPIPDLPTGEMAVAMTIATLNAQVLALSDEVARLSSMKAVVEGKT